MVEFPFPGAGIGVFDGTGDYLFAEHATEFDFGANAFSVSAWVYLTGGSGTYRKIVETTNVAGTDLAFSMQILNTNVARAGVFYSGTNYIVIGATTIALNRWWHIRLLKTPTTLYLFVNGLSEGTPVAVTTINNSPINGVTIGRTDYSGASGYYTGYMSEIDIKLESSPSTSNFIPLRQQLAPDANTKLLLHFLGSGNTFVDSSPSPKTITAYGNATQLHDTGSFGAGCSIGSPMMIGC